PRRPRRAEVLRLLVDGHRQRLPLAVADDLDLGRLAHRQPRHRALQLPAVADRLVGQPDDHVAGPQAGLVPRGGGVDARDLHAGGLFQLQLGGTLLVDVADADAQVAAADDAAGHQLIDDGLAQVAGDGQPDALEAAGAALDGRVDADHLALEADQRPAGVAGVDGRVGLQEVLVHVHPQGPRLAGDDAVRHRAGQAEGGADGQDAVPDLHRPAVAQ